MLLILFGSFSPFFEFQNLSLSYSFLKECPVQNSFQLIREQNPENKTTFLENPHLLQFCLVWSNFKAQTKLLCFRNSICEQKRTRKNIEIETLKTTRESPTSDVHKLRSTERFCFNFTAVLFQFPDVDLWHKNPASLPLNYVMHKIRSILSWEKREETLILT